MTMDISADGIAFIKEFEGLELDAYQDIAGIWTIGYGHTATACQDMRITEDKADTLLRWDLKLFEKAVNDAVNVELKQYEFDALVSLTFNIGAGAFRRSTALKRLNGGDRHGAAEAITWWNKATVDGELREVAGLTRRRRAEALMFLGGAGDRAEPEDLTRGVVAAPGACAAA